MPDEPSLKPIKPKESALENLLKKPRYKKKCQKQRHAKASEEAIAKSPEETQSAEHAETSQYLKLLDSLSCNYFKTYKIDADKYKDFSILFDDKSPS